MNARRSFGSLVLGWVLGAGLAVADEMPADPRLPDLKPCAPAETAAPASPVASTLVRQEVGGEFTLQLPACFVEEDPAPQFVHGGQRWKCGSAFIEVVWGIWGSGSFSEEYTPCQTQLGSKTAVLWTNTRNELDPGIIVYRTGAPHEPLISGGTKDPNDVPVLRQILRSARWK